MLSSWCFDSYVQSLSKAEDNITLKSLGSGGDTHMDLTAQLGICVTLGWWLKPVQLQRPHLQKEDLVVLTLNKIMSLEESA